VWSALTTLPGYECADDGRIRDRSRNVINDGAKLFGTYSRRDLLAREWCGPPPRHICVVCGKGPSYRVAHLNGDRRDFARDNLKFSPDCLAAVEHERRCLRWAMQSNEVPSARKAQSFRGPTRSHVADDDNWGSSYEKIPPFGINPGQ
jgi:hypothetical protein